MKKKKYVPPLCELLSLPTIVLLDVSLYEEEGIIQGAPRYWGGLIDDDDIDDEFETEE